MNRFIAQGLMIMGVATVVWLLAPLQARLQGRYSFAQPKSQDWVESMTWFGRAVAIFFAIIGAFVFFGGLLSG